MGLWAFGPLGAFEALGTSWAFLGLGLWGLERCPNNEVVMQVVRYGTVRRTRKSHLLHSI